MSLSITFKDVGLGDSLLLEWDSGHKVGIIDCNLVGTTNPTLSYIRSSAYAEIEFIVLSHPHLDHFSGLYELLDYCQNNNIRIKSFCFTIATQYLGIIQANQSLHDLSELIKVLDLMEAMYKRGQIADVLELDIQNKDILLTSDLSLSVLAPGYNQKNSLTKLQSKKSPKKKLSKAVDLNRIATVLKISSLSKNQFVLLTSDATKGTFKDILNKGMIKSQEHLMIAQMPHHGSKHNYVPSFWGNMKITKGVSTAIFSCGLSSLHSLPDSYVVTEAVNLGFNIHSTNKVNGLLPSTIATNSNLNKSNLLGLVSQLAGVTSLAARGNLSGDQVFTFPV